MSKKKRIVVKVGTSTLTHGTGRLNIRRVEILVKTLADLQNAGHEIILVSSGAIGLGMAKLGLMNKPKDTPTKQACAFGELYPQFREKGAVVLGVSKDSVASHKKFEEKYGLPFILLSDPEKEVIQAYDVWKEKKNYGKVSMGVVRTTYLIDENGIIMKAFGKVKAADNPAQMLGEL